VSTNISTAFLPEQQISRLFSLIGQPARIQILLVIGEQEACVCHLEKALGMRQASISQHLMILRKADLVTSRRDGRNIFYRITRPEILEILHQAAVLTGCNSEMLQALTVRPIQGCTCPDCNPGIEPNLCCQSIKPSCSS